MYHLLVRTQTWTPPNGTMPMARVFESTSDQLTEAFKPAGTLDERKVARIPALFVSEIGSEGSQMARVGFIHSLSSNSREISLRFTFDPDVPPIPNTDLNSLCEELEIADRELFRTHWAIKSADLFYVLFRKHHASPVAPTVFSFSDLESRRTDLVSIMMPFAASFDPVYDSLKEACRGLGLECKRADDFWEHEAIIQDIVSLICRSAVVICDCTGRNPNVFYEAGIAHSLGKPVILITQNEADIPFDLRHLRYVRYLNNGEGLERLVREIQPRIRQLTTPS